MFVAGPALVLAMLAVSGVAAVVLPPNGMVPMDLGVGSGLRWMPKAIGLVLWPAVGVVSYLVARLSWAFGRTSFSSQVGVTIALVLILLAQTASILVAIIRRGRP